MRIRTRLPMAAALIACLAATAPALLMASDHGDTVANVARPGADMADVYIFPSPANAANVVLVMNVHPLIPKGQGLGTTTPFDPNVLYQIKMDITGDFVEDLVIQAKFVGNGAGQQVVVAGPMKPITTGTTAYFARPNPTVGAINKPFTVQLPNGGGAMQVFAGGRSDPFFFDLERFFQLLPDRMMPLHGVEGGYPTIMAADTPQPPVSFRGFPNDATHPSPTFDHSAASDLLLNFNVLSIVFELPRAALGGGVIRLWETTSVAAGAPNFNFTQQDRLARPAINEVLATVSLSRHDMNNRVNPTDDHNFIMKDILAFMNYPAGRSTTIANTLASILVPDVMIADLSQAGPASYLGYEASGGKAFGGRALASDVVDLDLMAVFGNLIPAVTGVMDDGKETPQLTTDNIGPHGDYSNTFPYLGNPG